MKHFKVDLKIMMELNGKIKDILKKKTKSDASVQTDDTGSQSNLSNSNGIKNAIKQSSDAIKNTDDKMIEIKSDQNFK